MLTFCWRNSQNSMGKAPDFSCFRSLSCEKDLKPIKCIPAKINISLHFFSLSELKKVHIEVKETAATKPAHKPSAPAEQENGSEEEDEEDDEDDEDDEEDESEEEDEEEEKDSQTAQDKSVKEESSESSSESDSDDERTKEERMYDKAKRRIEVQI